MLTIVAPSSRSLTALRRPLWRGLALVLTYNGLLAAWLTLRPAPSPVIQVVDNVAQCAGPLLVLPLCWGGLAPPWRPRPGVSSAARWVPVLLGLGLLGDAVGQALWTYDAVAPPALSLSLWASAGYLSFYPSLLLGILLLPTRPLQGAARTRVLMDGLMIMVAVATFSWYYLLGPTVLQGDTSVADKVVGAASTLGDLVLIVCLLLLWARADDGAMQRVVRPLALGLGVIVVTDGAFDYGTLRGTYATGGLVDVGWPLGYMLVGLAALALRQALARPAAARASAPLLPARPVRRIARLWRCAKPYLPYALVPAVLALVGNARAARGYVAAALEPGVYLGGALLIGLVLVRQVVALRENQRLYQQVEERNQALAAANARLETLASTDPLTGLLNHRAFHARFDEEIARAARGGRPLALLLVDLDDFRAINNTHGHQAGDRALVAIAATLRGSLRAGDSAGRYGGDEFAAILPEADLSEALAVAERARAAVAGIALPAGDATIRATTSLGVAVLPQHARTRDALIAAADQAAYAAKDAGKDCVRPSGEPLRQTLVGRAIDGATPVLRVEGVDAPGPTLAWDL